MIRFLSKACWGDQGGAGFGYRVAGHDLCADVPLRLLAGYETARPLPAPGAQAIPMVGPQAAVIATVGWLAGEHRRVLCRGGVMAYELDMAGLGRVVVDRGGREIYCAGAAPDVALGFNAI